MWKFLTLLFQLFLSPVNGWNDVSYADVNPKDLATKGFYPLLLITSLTVFLQGLYHVGFSFVSLLQLCIIMFVKFFLSFFISNFIFSMYGFRYSERGDSEKHNQTFILFSLSLLALSSLIQNLIPMDLDVVYFLSIYVAIIMWRGVKYMAIYPDKRGSFMIFSILTIIVPPYLIGFLFEKIVQ